MDPLLPALLTGLLAEIGDKTQLLVVLLAIRFNRPAAILAGVAVAALANSLMAGIAGGLMHGLLNDRALGLMLAVALLSLGIGGFWWPKPYDAAKDWRLGAFATSAVAFFILEFGDKTQLATFAFAARSHAPLFAAIGATIGIVAASVPAAVLGPDLARSVPLRPLRYAAAALFTVIGGWVAVSSLQLI